ncbi:hypothetical protein Bca4012_058716 [Brassica carinata]
MASSSSASNRRRNREYRSPSPNLSSSSSEDGDDEPQFMTFESRLATTRGFFVAGPAVANPWSMRHVTEESFRKYQQLCIRGFLVQGMLALDDPAFAEARTIIDNRGWMYTVLHVRPFCPRVVRECISNLNNAEDGVYIRGRRFDFDPVVINQLFMTPLTAQSRSWVDVDLSQAISFLTAGRSSRWETFSLTHLLPQNMPIDFGVLVYDQVIEMCRTPEADKKIVLPNFIYQTLILQREILALPVDEPLIGEPHRMYGVEADLSIRRGRRGRINSESG